MVFLMSKSEKKVIKAFNDEYFYIKNIAYLETPSPYEEDFRLEDEEDEDWVLGIINILLLKCSIELIEELLHRIERKIGDIKESGGDLREKLNKLKWKISNGLQAMERTILPKDVDDLFKKEGHPPSGFGIRKEAIPFFYYHDKKYEEDGKLVGNPRRYNKLLVDSAENQDDMRKRPFVIEDRVSGKYLRYIIKNEEFHVEDPRDPDSREHAYIIFQRAPYRKCARCGKDCTKLLHKCGGCKCISYCCKEHQVADRVKHTKEVCRAMRLRREAIKQEEAARDSESKSEIGSDSD